MNIWNSLIKIICIVIAVFIIGHSLTKAYGEEYNDMVTKLKKSYPFTPPVSEEIPEDQLMRFFAVVKVMHELLENKTGGDRIRLAGVKELDVQK